MLTFPQIEARNLEGHNLHVPGDLAGERNVIIMAFRRWHQRLVDAWMPYLRELQADVPGLQIYEMPMLSAMYLLVRPFIDGGMAMAIPDRHVRATTLTVYTNVQQVVTTLELPTQETIYLFLVDRSGQIFWRGQGEYAEESALELKQALR